MAGAIAGTFFKLFVSDLVNIQAPLVRYGHHIRGKPPGVARSLQQRLDELNYQDPELTSKVDIGFQQPKRSRSADLTERLAHLKKERSNQELEKLARLRQLEVPLQGMKEEWLRTVGPSQIKMIAEHYGIYDHLFGDAYFVPRVMVDIGLKQTDGNFAPVHRGNIIKPSEASFTPSVSYQASPESLWTLVLTNPDGHFTEDNSEYVHWFVGNIPGNDIAKGEVIWDYLQPFPPKGTGYHRFVFVLYRQEKRIDYSKLQKPSPCLNLNERTFKTLDFYRERQDNLTPAGLAFFQSDWDPTLTDFYHHTLDMKEPVFEFDFPEPYIRPQAWFPLRQPFNLYMDKYRDPKQIAKEFLLKKLQKTHPFKKPDPPPKFPNAFAISHKVPSWLKLEKKKERMGWGRINDF